MGFKGIRAIVFDLDGTLIDGYEAIHDALVYAMTQLGFPSPTPEETRLMVGHGLEQLLIKAVGHELAPKGVELYRNYYPEVVIEKSHLLPNVKSVLDTLSKQGYKMCIASNKPEQYTHQILEHQQVTEYFSEILGPEENRYSPKPNPAMLHALMNIMQSNPSETVCVGDMEVDVEFARAGGTSVIVIPSGSRDRDFLLSAGADLVLSELAHLPDVLRA